MTTEQTIHDAIAGGWIMEDGYEMKYEAIDVDGILLSASPEYGADYYSIEKMLLDPKFWQAVGKTRGWSRQTCPHCMALVELGEDSLSTNALCDHKNLADIARRWRDKMHRFIDHRADGCSIDDALAKL